MRVNVYQGSGYTQGILIASDPGESEDDVHGDRDDQGDSDLVISGSVSSAPSTAVS